MSFPSINLFQFTCLFLSWRPDKGQPNAWPYDRYETSDLSFHIYNMQSHKPFCYVALLPFQVILQNDSTSGCWRYCFETDYNHFDSKN